MNRTAEDEEALYQPPKKKRASKGTFANTDSMFVSGDEGGYNESANNAGMLDEDEDNENLAPLSTNEPSGITELATRTRSVSDDRGRDHESGNNAGPTEGDDASSELSSIEESAIDDTASVGDNGGRDDQSANDGRLEKDDDELTTELSSVYESANSDKMSFDYSQGRSDKAATNARLEDEDEDEDEPIFRGNRKTMLVIARLKLSDEFRVVDTENVHSIEGLFGACGAVWGIRVAKLYLYLPPPSGKIDVQANGSKIFNMFVRDLRNTAVSPDSFTVRLMVLVEGETYGAVDVDASD